VTVPLNWLGVLFALLALFELGAFWKSRSSKSKLVQSVSIGLIVIAQAMLFWLHPQIDSFVDLKAAEVTGDYDRFYLLHRLYLWTITVQWIAAWIWLICFVDRSRQSAHD
jgi:hypothetical protein